MKFTPKIDLNLIDSVLFIHFRKKLPFNLVRVQNEPFNVAKICHKGYTSQTRRETIEIHRNFA